MKHQDAKLRFYEIIARKIHSGVYFTNNGSFSKNQKVQDDFGGEYRQWHVSVCEHKMVR